VFAVLPRRARDASEFAPKTGSESGVVRDYGSLWKRDFEASLMLCNDRCLLVRFVLQKVDAAS
jgi:hypothetical protein